MAGSGNFVDVDEQHVLLDDMSSEIETTIAYTRTFADTQMTNLSTAISNLETAIGTHTVAVEDIDATYYGVSEDLTFPDAPSFASLVLDEYPTADVDDPVILPFDDIDFTFTAPTPPASQSSSFSWAAGTYSSEMWANLFAAVHGKILGGDYGLSSIAHAAIVAREQSQREANQDKEYQALNDSLGATGWNLGSGHTAYALSEFSEEIVRRDQDALNNITVKDFEIANENEKFFITSGTDIEKLLRDTFERAEDRSLDAAKAADDYIHRFFSENVKLYLGEWEGVKAKIEAAKSQVEAIASANDSEVRVFETRWSAFKTNVEAISSSNLARLEDRKTEADVYKAQVEAVAEEGRFLLEDVKQNQENIKNRLEHALGVADLELKAYNDASTIGVAVTQGIANIASQGVASALGAINTSLSNSYSGTEHRSESWGHSDSISEQHSYSEEGA